VTFNDFNGVIALSWLYFAEFDSFAGLFRHSWLKIDLHVYCLQNIVFHFWPKLIHHAARSLCDSWATCKGYGAKTYERISE